MAISHYITVMDRGFHLWLGVLMALIFACAPMISSAHVNAECATTCTTDNEISPRDEVSMIKGQHDHKAHHCGSCQVQIIRRDTGQPNLALFSKAPAWPREPTGILQSPTATLFRPPRS